MTETPRADALLTALISGDPQIEAFADLTDEREREKALHVLLALLTDPSDVLRLRAVKALGVLGDRRAVESLIRSLNNTRMTPDVFEASFAVLLSFGDPEAILPLAVHPLTVVTFQDQLLTWFDKKDLIRVLGDAVAHPDVERKRRMVIILLGQIEDPESVEILLKALNDDDMMVRVDAASALMRMGIIDAIPFLLPYTTASEIWTRQYTALTLGHLGDPRAIPALLPLLEEQRPSIRFQAAIALAALGDPIGVELTCASIITGNPLFVYIFLNNALKALKSVQVAVVPLLIQMAEHLFNRRLTDERNALARIADILGEEGDPVALPVLERMLVIKRDFVQQAAQQAIDAIKARIKDYDD